MIARRSIALASLLAGGVAFASCVADPPQNKGDRDSEHVARAPQPIEAAPPWSETGAMSVARFAFTASTLLDGRVLIVGGMRTGSVDTGAVTFESAEMWTGPQGTFKVQGAKMSVKRAWHTAAVLTDGRVLIVGGSGGPTSEIFDPVSKQWSAPAGLLHDHGVQATLTLLNDGRALLVGGDPAGAAEIFDPAANTWIDTGPLLFPRRQHAATRLKDGRVLVTGGVVLAPTEAVTATAEIYDPKAGAWTIAKKMLTPRTAHGAALLASGQVIIVAGASDVEPALASAHVYDPLKNTWSEAGSLTNERVQHATTLLDNGAVLVTGGIDKIGSVLRSAELFDPDAAKWIDAGQLHHGRLAHAAAPLAGGALAAGGEDQSTAEIWSLAGDGQPCEVGRQCASGFCVDAVCCNTSCDGQCVTCALPGSEGDCSIAAAGTDPHLDCGGGAPCDDVCASDGTCADRVGEVCVPSACVDDGASAIVQATCAAPGAPCDTITIDCAPYRCGATSGDAMGCLTKCASLDDCADGYACDPEHKCRLRPDVAAVDPEACSVHSGAPTEGGAAWLTVIAIAASASIARRSRRSRS